jgi:hypothetical protein
VAGGGWGEVGGGGGGSLEVGGGVVEGGATVGALLEGAGAGSLHLKREASTGDAASLADGAGDVGGDARAGLGDDACEVLGVAAGEPVDSECTDEDAGGAASTFKGRDVDAFGCSCSGTDGGGELAGDAAGGPPVGGVHACDGVVPRNALVCHAFGSPVRWKVSSASVTPRPAQ